MPYFCSLSPFLTMLLFFKSILWQAANVTWKIGSNMFDFKFLEFHLTKSNFRLVAIYSIKTHLHYLFRIEEVDLISKILKWCFLTEKLSKINFCTFCLVFSEGRKYKVQLYFLDSEKIIQMPLNWVNGNQSEIWFCQMKIQEISNQTYYYQFFMSHWLPAIK